MSQYSAEWRAQKPPDSPTSIALARGPEGGGLKAPLADLLAYAEMMSDWEIAHDFDDCILPVARSDEDRAALSAYARARKKARGFDGRRSPSKAKPSGNNHRAMMGTGGWMIPDLPAPESAHMFDCAECAAPNLLPDQSDHTEWCSSRVLMLEAA